MSKKRVDKVKKVTERICGIYKITNSVDGKCYIGQSIDIYRRWRQHEQGYRGINTQSHLPLYEAMRKDGIDNFTFEILEECTQYELLFRERYYINLYDSESKESGYNTPSSNNDPGKFYHCVDEIIDLLQHGGFTQRELIDLYNTGHSTIGQINQGIIHKRWDLEYPLQSKENEAILHKMRDKRFRPDVDFRKTHSPIECYEEYKRKCLEAFNQGEEVVILFDEMFNVDLIDEILTYGKAAVSRKYGCKHPSGLCHRLLALDMPYLREEMYEFYLKEKGHEHPSRRKTENEREKRSGKQMLGHIIAQYDAHTREILNIYENSGKARENVKPDFKNPDITGCYRGETKTAAGFIWRIVSPEGEIVPAVQYKEYVESHQHVCLACGCAMLRDDENEKYCKTCREIKDEISNLKQFLDRDFLMRCLSLCNTTQLAILANATPPAVTNYVKQLGITPEEIEAARNAVKEKRLAKLREKLPKVLPEGW